MVELKEKVEAKPTKEKTNSSGQLPEQAQARTRVADISDPKFGEESAGTTVQSELSPAVSHDDNNHNEGTATTKKPLYKRPAVLAVAALVLVVASITGLRFLLYARSHESTDDAFIDGHIIQISAKATGYVTRVYVTDNQQVKAGDLIVELDARDYEARLQLAKTALDTALARENEARTNVSLTRSTSAAAVAQAKASVQRARSGVESSRAGAISSQSRAQQAASAVSTANANLEQARAQVLAAEAEANRARADVVRYQELFRKDEVSKQQLDKAVATADQASAQLDAAHQRVVAASAQVNEARSAEMAARETAQQDQTQVGGAEAGVGEALGRLAQANTAPQQVAVSQAQSDTAGATTEQLRAEVAQAELNLSYTKIYASEDGRVTRKSVEEGAQVQIGQPLLALVPGDVWVTANFKEVQIGRMVAGQPVDISVDAYPDKVFKGRVDSIQAGTGARFSVIPPENATGNYVKVVQRVPVKIVFDEPLDSRHILAPGMSVVPEVSIR